MWSKTKTTIVGWCIVIAIVAAIVWLVIYVFPDKVSSRTETALIVGAGIECEVKPLRGGGSVEFDVVKLKPQRYVEFEVDGETYKIVGNDVYDTYKDNIGDSVEIKVKTSYYPFVSKFKKMITIPASPN